MKKLGEHLETIGILVGLIAILGGFIYWSGTPPFASEAELEKYIAKHQVQIRAKFLIIDLDNKEQKVDNLHKRIFNLEAMKLDYKQSRRPWPLQFEEELQRLGHQLTREQKKYDKLLDVVEEGKK